MNEFTKQWITSTCAPESIINLKDGSHFGTRIYIDVVRNEDDSKRAMVISNDIQVLKIAYTNEDIWNSKMEGISFADGIKKVAEMLDLTNISV